MSPVIGYKSPYALLLLSLIGMFPCSAIAVQWLPLASTTRYQVAIDNDSIRLTPLGRLGAWLRFIPQGDAQRKAAATDYGEKGYRSHLEYYEIDCSEQSAVLGLIDIFGTSKTRLKRLKGGVQPDAITPGSVLDRAAVRICPTLDDETLEEEPEAPEPEGETSSIPDSQPDEELQLKIRILVKKSVDDPSNIEVLRSLGNAYFDADLPEQAIAAYNRALALRPADTDILNDQGAMYRQIGEYSKALANFEKAFRIDPKNLESLYNSGYVYAFDLNDIPKALDVWRRYLTLDSSSETARTVQGFVDRYGKGQNR
ncbi:MAG: tetratricopeptide repeat protein [Steroidobacteraceae bacterium]|nr:tetratricopeptide repeat protein [Deltaproteobacteria bacterium]